MILFLVGFLVTGCSLENLQFQSSQRREYDAQRIRDKYPHWDDLTVYKVASKRVEIGMTHEMVWAALGEPDKVSREGDEEEWGYAKLVQRGWDFHKKLVYFVSFKEDKVAKITGDRSELEYLYWYK